MVKSLPSHCKGARVPSLVGELRSHRLRGVVKTNKNKITEESVDLRSSRHKKKKIMYGDEC